jgi:Na+(H+)/acetate symporter ActP
MKQNRSALDMALSVASLINGPILGVFLVGVFLKRVGQTPALIGMIVSLVLMLCVYLASVNSSASLVQLAQTIFPFKIAWPWYVLFGSLITLIVAWLASFAFEPAPKNRRDELAPRAVAE